MVAISKSCGNIREEERCYRQFPRSGRRRDPETDLRFLKFGRCLAGDDFDLTAADAQIGQFAVRQLLQLFVSGAVGGLTSEGVLQAFEGRSEACKEACVMCADVVCECHYRIFLYSCVSSAGAAGFALGRLFPVVLRQT